MIFKRDDFLFQSGLFSDVYNNQHPPHEVSISDFELVGPRPRRVDKLYTHKENPK